MVFRVFFLKLLENVRSTWDNFVYYFKYFKENCQFFVVDLSAFICPEQKDREYIFVKIVVYLNFNNNITIFCHKLVRKFTQCLQQYLSMQSS